MVCKLQLNKKKFRYLLLPKIFICMAYSYYGLPWWLTNKEIACQCRRCGLDPWIGKISWSRKWQPIFFPPVLLPGKSHRQRIVVGYSPVCVLSC